MYEENTIDERVPVNRMKWSQCDQCDVCRHARAAGVVNFHHVSSYAELTQPEEVLHMDLQGFSVGFSTCLSC